MSRPLLLVTNHVPPDRVGALQLLNEHEDLVVAITARNRPLAARAKAWRWLMRTDGTPGSSTPSVAWCSRPS